MKTVIPAYVIGSGNAALALQSALGLVVQRDPEGPAFEVRPLRRGENLPKVSGPALLLIANPHALHAALILEAEQKGFSYVVTEKPAVVSLEQADSLEKVSIPVAVCHGYRQHWGPRKIKQAIASGELGKVISVEGRYWQSSAAARALTAQGPSTSWKNNTALSGPYDTYLDLGTHWADLVSFVLGKNAVAARANISYTNAEAAHRDTHVQLSIDFEGDLHTWGSVSKTVHGAGNHLELIVLGEKATMGWNFEKPDELWVGKGKETVKFSRSNEEPVASKLPAHHALGWLEGYVSILTSVARQMTGRQGESIPTLKDSLAIARLLLGAGQS